MANTRSSDLEDAIVQAHDELGDPAFDRELHRAEDVGEQAGRRAFWLWLLCLITVAVAVATVVSNPFFAVVIPLLLFLFTLPLVAAGQVTAEREGERERLLDAIHDHQRRTRSVSPRAPLGTARPPVGIARQEDEPPGPSERYGDAQPRPETRPPQ